MQARGSWVFRCLSWALSLLALAGSAGARKGLLYTPNSSRARPRGARALVRGKRARLTTSEGVKSSRARPGGALALDGPGSWSIRVALHAQSTARGG